MGDTELVAQERSDSQQRDIGSTGGDALRNKVSALLTALSLLAAPAMVGSLSGCDVLSSSSDNDADEASEDSSKSKKKKNRNKKKDDEDGDDTESKNDEDEALDVNAVFGESPSFGGTFDMFGDEMFGATSHSAIEPGNFSAGWVGRESYDILKRARDGEFRNSQVRTASRRICLVFKEGNTVRRGMLATRRDAPTEELAFAANGNLILWYRHNRKKQSVEDWAYFHGGNQLMLYQVRHKGGTRRTENASPALRDHILRGSRECVQTAHANNPIPGAAPRPVPAIVPQPAAVPPPGGGNAPSGSPPPPTALHFGALAFSESKSAWRISYRKGSMQGARNEAVGACPHADCKIRATFTKGQCMSVVHGPAPLVTWGWANDNNSARDNSIQQCTQRGHAPEACEVKGTWCNDG